jgi:hypothetical protein
MCVINRHVVHLSPPPSLPLSLSPVARVSLPISSSSRSRSTNAPYIALYRTLMCMYLPARASVYLCHRRAVSPGSSPPARTVQGDDSVHLRRTRAPVRLNYRPRDHPSDSCPPDASASVDGELASKAAGRSHLLADESVRSQSTHPKILNDGRDGRPLIFPGIR